MEQERRRALDEDDAEPEGAGEGEQAGTTLDPAAEPFRPAQKGPSGSEEERTLDAEGEVEEEETMEVELEEGERTDDREEGEMRVD